MKQSQEIKEKRPLFKLSLRGLPNCIEAARDDV
jgi:hypothetical protein